jgi:hypothetical protein
VSVVDRTGAQRPAYVFSTDGELAVTEVVERSTGRRHSETPFPEMRSYLKLEETRGCTGEAVPRTAACLFGLYAEIALW